MRKLIVIAAAVGSLGFIAASALAQVAASPSQTYTVKIVCGTESPQPRLVAPSEPPVKPGNYATEVNIESLAAVPEGSSVLGFVSVPGASPTEPVSVGLSSAFQVVNFNCADFVTALGKSKPAGSFFTGYFNMQTSTPISVTAVYSSQGCTFLPLLPTTCNGAVTVDVVPQQAVVSSSPTC
jgi:hypothetical protein